MLTLMDTAVQRQASQPVSASPKVALCRRVQRTSLQAALVLLVALGGDYALALQALDGTDGATLQGVISLKEPTRVRVEGAAITGVVGNVYSIHNCEEGGAGPAGALAAGAGAIAIPRGQASAVASSAASVVSAQGEVAMECDRDKGEVYLKPMGASPKPINLFVSTAGATYTLLLQRADRPADTIVIRDKGAGTSAGRIVRGAAQAVWGEQVSYQQGAAQGLGMDASRQGQAIGPPPSHIRALKAMLVAMASNRVPTDMRITQVNEPVKLWDQSRLLLMRVFDWRGLVGELYQLTNISTQELVLADQEFDRESGDVVGVAIDNHTLAPGASTAVYVIRLGGDK